MFQYQLAKTINSTDTKPTLLETGNSIKIHHFEISQLHHNIERKQHRNHNKVQSPAKKKQRFRHAPYFHILYPFGNFKGSLWKNQNHHVASSNPSCK